MCRYTSPPQDLGSNKKQARKENFDLFKYEDQGNTASVALHVWP